MDAKSNLDLQQENNSITERKGIDFFLLNQMDIIIRSSLGDRGSIYWILILFFQFLLT